MKLKLIASLVAASFLAGCSSSGSNDTSPQAGIENPIELPLWGDEGAKEVTFVEIKGQTNIIVDGESVGRVKDGTVYNSNGDIVGTVDIVQKDENGQPIAFVGKTANGADITWTKSGGLVINNPPQQEKPIEIPVWGGDEAKHIELVELNGQTVLTVNNETVAYVVNGDVRNAQGDSIGSLTYHEKDANGNPSVVVIQGHDGNTYSWNKSTGLNISKTNVDSGWGHQPTPDNDLPEFGLDTRESRYHFEESVPNSLWSIVNSETGDVIGQAVITTDNNIKIRIGDKDHQFTNTKALQDENGNLTSIAFKTPSGKSGYWSKDDGFVMTNGNPVDGGWGHQPTPDQIDSIKDKTKYLSQEQRQQIKQAIKDRAPRS